MGPYKNKQQRKVTKTLENIVLLTKIEIMNDETVVRTRLLLDGDGTGDDRRLNMIAKSLIKWISIKDDDDSEKAKEENIKNYSRLMANIAQCEWIESKTKLVQDMNKVEAQNYDQLYDKIKNEIRKAEEEIRETKEELVKARKIRRNRMEYDAMAKVINKNPDRDTQGIKIEEIKSEIEQLKVTEAALEDKLESRKKQFHVLVQSIHNLQALLDEDNEINLTDKESIDESQIDDDIIVMDV